MLGGLNVYRLSSNAFLCFCAIAQIVVTVPKERRIELWLLRLLIFLPLTACGSDSEPDVVRRIDATLAMCTAAADSSASEADMEDFPCVAKHVTEYCSNRYDVGLIPDFLSWSECWIADLGEYCTRRRYITGLEACLDRGAQVLMAENPYWPNIGHAMQKVFDECDSPRNPADQSSHVVRAQCINDGYHAVFLRYRFPADSYRDIAEKRMDIAQRLDAGKISVAQADLEWQAYFPDSNDVPQR